MFTLSPEALISKLDETLSSNKDKWIEYIKSHNLEPNVDNIIDILSEIRGRARPHPNAGEVSADLETDSFVMTKKKVCESVLSDSDSDNESSDEVQPKNYKFEKKSYRPRCFDMFSINNFTKFVEMRNMLDMALKNISIRNTGIEIEKNILKMIESLKETDANFFKNIHIVAYFYNKLAKYVIYDVRVNIITKICPKLKISRRSLANFKMWGSALDHESELQWFAGIDNEKVSMSSVVNWKASLKLYKGRETFIDVVILGVKYSVPI
jgi:hypothetical protein